MDMIPARLGGLVSRARANSQPGIDGHPFAGFVHSFPRWAAREIKSLSEDAIRLDGPGRRCQDTSLARRPGYRLHVRRPSLRSEALFVLARSSDAGGGQRLARPEPSKSAWASIKNRRHEVMKFRHRDVQVTEVRGDGGAMLPQAAW